MGKNIEFDILARDRASKAFDSVSSSVDRTSHKAGGLGSAFKAGLGAAGGLLAAAGIGKAFDAVTDTIGSAIAEARESEKVGKTTAQIIKSTGGAAKVSAAQVGDLATAISNKTGIDDEAIQSGSNLLLTFKKVRNEVGEGANVFDRATQAATDLSAAGFGDIAGASKMLGKALNDPLKGLTALGKAGVTFTDQQKKQIKTLVESGDVLGAQKIILGEVESQVGGVAAASSTMGEKVKTTWDNLKEQAGTKLLPVIDKLGLGVLGLIDGFTTGEVSTDGFAGKMQRLGKWVKTDVLPVFQRFGGWIKNDLWPALQKGYQTIMPGLKTALGIVTGGVDGGGMSWKKFGDILTTKVIPFVSKMISYYLPVLATNIRTGMEAVKAIYRAFETWRDIVARVVGFIIGKFADMSGMWATVLRALGKVPGFGWAKDAADKMQRASDKARGIANAVNAIPGYKKVTVDVVSRVTSGRISDGRGGQINAGMRADGGPVRAGRPYMVGENGPELVIPRKDGMVIPSELAAQIRGSSVGDRLGGDQNVTVQLVLDGKVIQQSLLKLKRQGGVTLGLA